jgi:hypothetical protein
MGILTNLLDGPLILAPVFTAEDTLSDIQFASLTEEIEVIRAKIIAGEEASVEEARKVVIWFRARRVKNFILHKVKVVKEKAPPRVKNPAGAKRTKASDVDALTLLAGL